MQLATQIRIIAPAAALAAALVSAAAVYWGYLSIASDQRLAGIAARTEADAARLQAELRKFQDDVAFLADAKPIREYAAQTTADFGSADETGRLRGDTAELLLSLMRVHPDYYQARVIGADGFELVRVERDAGRILAVDSGQLQDKSAEPYFGATMSLQPNQRFVSGINLNREFGELEIPHRPMLRASMPLFSSVGESTGMVIINLDFESFIERVLPVDSMEYGYFLANSAGEFVLHPDATQTFAFEFGQSSNFVEAFSQLQSVLTAGASQASAAVDNGGQRLAAARRVSHVLDEPERFLILTVTAEPVALAASAAEIGTTVLQTTVVLVVLVAIGAAVFAGRLIGPLRQLADEANAIQAGGSFSFGQQSRTDEVGILAKALRAMHARTESDRLEIAQHNRDLEFFIKSSSHDLVEPARRIALLSDMLAEGDDDAAASQAGQDVERIRQESHLIVARLSDLRDFIQSSSEIEIRELVDMQQLVTDTVAEVRGDGEAEQVAFHIESLPKCRVYPALVRVLYRLLIQHILSEWKEPELQIICRAGESDSSVAFEVFGSTSFDCERTEQRVSTEVVDWSGYSGHRLSLCRRLVERHGGRAWTEDVANRPRYIFTLDRGSSNEPGA